MSIDSDLLAILCCPETKQPVSVAEASLIEKINAALARGEVKNRGNRPMTGHIDGGLLRADQKILYPIRDSIPVMLIEEGIPLEQLQ
ncbi:MAG: Trm112 family protein [Nitrospira sp.]